MLFIFFYIRGLVAKKVDISPLKQEKNNLLYYYNFQNYSNFDAEYRLIKYIIFCTQVSSVNLSKFTTGEVVNMMSTDTDRVVNFCQSFHAFWSLPLQVRVVYVL